jgi:hypothetical protein
MQTVTTIGFDIAKSVFQVHGIDAAEKVVVRKQLRRSQVRAFGGAVSFPRFVGAKARSVYPNERTYRHCDWPGERVPRREVAW